MRILLNLAKLYARIYKKDLFVGITGSIGKDNFIEALNNVLSSKYPVITNRFNQDPLLGISGTILRVNPKVKKVLLEMGVEQIVKMEDYLSIINPKTIIVTKLDSNFLDQAIKLIEQLPQNGLAILNGDDQLCKNMAEKTGAEVIYYGTDQKTCSVWAGNIKIQNFKTVFELNYGVERVQVEYQLLGEHQVYSALAAAAFGILEGVPLISIKKALELVNSPVHNLQVLAGVNNSIVIDDTHDSSLATLEAAIDTLMAVSARRRILVLGEMKDMTSQNDQLYRRIARKIYSEKIDMVFLGTGETNFIADELEKLGFWEEKLQSNLQNPQIVSKLLRTLGKGDVCLVKGSKAIRLDEVVKRITKK